MSDFPLLVGRTLAGDLPPDVVDSLGDTYARRGSLAFHEIYVDASGGSDTNLGTLSAAPVRSLAQVDTLIQALDITSVPTFVRVNLAGTFDRGHTFANLDNRSVGITFQGQPLVGGVPVTTINRGSSSAGFGLRFDPSRASVSVLNVAFTGFAVGFNGYGVLAKGGGSLTVTDCTADGCDWGFAAIRNVSYSMLRCTATNCNSAGFMAQYNASGSMNYCLAKNAGRGYYVTRNSVGHVDYSVAEDCTIAGLLIDMGSRVAAVQVNFRRNAYGVRAEGAAEWLNDGCIFNLGTDDANTVAYGHFGAARENRLYSLASTAEFRTYTNIGTYTTAAGVEEVLVALGSDAPLPAGFLTNKPKRIRVVISGELTGAAFKSFGLYRTTTTGGGQASVGHMSTNASGIFRLEITLHALTATTQRAFVELAAGGTSSTSGRVQLVKQDKALNVGEEWRFRFLANSGDTASSVTVNAIDLFVSG